MKYYNSVGPNPRVVNMFMAEKGVKIQQAWVDILKGENHQSEYASKNPSKNTPALELEDGLVLAEITVLCEYIEELHPEPVLIGSTPRERAETRMWVRRIDLGIAETMANGFRYSQGLPMFKDRIHCIPAAADDLKAIAQEKLTWLDGLISGRTWVCGDRFTLADILLYCFLDFGVQVGQAINPDNRTVAALYERAAARASAAVTA
jgi:glutathione S-transferase